MRSQLMFCVFLGVNKSIEMPTLMSVLYLLTSTVCVSDVCHLSVPQSSIVRNARAPNVCISTARKSPKKYHLLVCEVKLLVLLKKIQLYIQRLTSAVGSALWPQSLRWAGEVRMCREMLFCCFGLQHIHNNTDIQFCNINSVLISMCYCECKTGCTDSEAVIKGLCRLSPLTCFGNGDT